MEKLTTQSMRQAQVLVLTPILVLIIGAILALTIDVGRIVQEKTQLQNACDAAALAGAEVLLARQVDGKKEDVCRADADEAAQAFFRANSTDAAPTIEFGCEGAGGSFVAAGAKDTATLVRASAARDGSSSGARLPLFFASFIGVSNASVSASAMAEVATSVRGVLCNLSPFAVPVGRVPAVGQTVTFYPGDPTAYDGGLGEDTVVPGNWGLLNLDGGDSSTSEMVDWIENGTGRLVIPANADYVWINGSSGFRSALNKPIKAKIGEPIIVVVYDQVIGTGSNAEFRCIGFLSVTITDCKLVGKNPYATCRVDQIVDLHDLVTGGWISPNVRKVQLVN